MKPPRRERADLARPSRRVVDGDADRRSALKLIAVSRETEARLADYVDRLHRWQTIKNLVGPSTLQEVWTRHIADSAQLVALAPQARRWVDLGSGGGFPGLVIALLLHGQPDVQVDLIESSERKCAFLREVVRATGAPARVHAGRIEAVVGVLGEGVEVVTSRALAALPELLAMSAPLLDRGALGLFLKGDEEIQPNAVDPSGPIGASHAYHIEALPSRTHARGRIVVVRRADLWENGWRVETRGGRNAE